jgi:hypothetical protein
LREQLDERTMLDLPARMRSLYEEIFRKSVAAKTVAEKNYKKTVEERVDEVGDRVLVFDLERTSLRDASREYRGLDHMS